MNDPKDKLPPASDKLLRKVRELGATEIEKRKEPISSPRFHELAADVTKKSREIMFSAVDEEDIGNQTERSDLTIDRVDADDERTG